MRADHDEYPLIDADTADFTYARLMRSVEEEPTGYSSGAIGKWADEAKNWSAKGDAFVYFISGAKVRAPAAAQALIATLGT